MTIQKGLQIGSLVVSAVALIGVLEWKGYGPTLSQPSTVTLAGHKLTDPLQRTNRNGLSAPEEKRRPAVVWVLQGGDCNWCNASEVGYWRRLATECPDVDIEVIAVGPDSSKVRTFTTRYRFPGYVTTATTMDALGIGGMSTPLWLLVDTTSTVVLSTGTRNVSYPFPVQVLEAARALGGCRFGERATSN
jgi:hypothetical protein